MSQFFKSTADRAKAVGARVGSGYTATTVQASQVRQRAAVGARQRVRGAAEHSLDWALNRSAARLRDGLVDEDAPAPVRKLAQLVFDSIWPEVAAELKDNLMTAVNQTIDGYVQPWTDARAVSGLAAVRAWFLYSFQPFDKSQVHQLKNPSYYLLLAWASTSYYGAQGLFWLTMFLLMDKRDEYTLVNFILSFKALQFVTLGFVGITTTAFTYHICLTSKDPHACEKAAPGLAPDFFHTEGAFWFQSLMVWVAFALLPFSSRKAGTTAAAVDEAAAQGTLAEVSADPTGAESAATRKASADADDGDAPRRYRQDAGGWLRGMIAYDMLCFGLVLGWVLWFGQSSGALAAPAADWRFRATCAFARVAYGLLSFPFILFVIPPLNAILTHASPTAYNTAGDAVPLLRPKQRREKERVDRGELARPPPTPGVYGRLKEKAASAGGQLVTGASGVVHNASDAVRNARARRTTSQTQGQPASSLEAGTGGGTPRML